MAPLAASDIRLKRALHKEPEEERMRRQARLRIAAADVKGGGIIGHATRRIALNRERWPKAGESPTGDVHTVEDAKSEPAIRCPTTVTPAAGEAAIGG